MACGATAAATSIPNNGEGAWEGVTRRAEALIRSVAALALLAVAALGFLAFFICSQFVVYNAVAQAIKDEQYGLAVGELALFPITYGVYPFTASEGAEAWPFTDGTTFVPALVIGVVGFVLAGVGRVFADDY